MSAIIQINQISKQIQKNNDIVSILPTCSLTIQCGDMVAITGQSGVGKSTLLNIIGCLDSPSSGVYYLEKQNTLLLTPEERAKLRKQYFGYIFQQYWLIKHLTIRENIELALHYRNEKNITQKTTDVLKKLELLSLADQRPNQLSGGQQQKSSIARAIVTRPSILLADEPTGALDTDSSHQVMALLKSINQAEKTTIVIVTHDHKMAEFCDQQWSMTSLFQHQGNQHALA